MSVVGEGRIDLGTETIDMILRPRPKEPRLLDLAVPVHLTGPLRKPVSALTPTGVSRKLATTLGVLINPLLILVPIIEGAAADRNPCVSALVNVGNGAPGQAGAQAAPGIAERLRGIARSVDRALGGP